MHRQLVVAAFAFVSFVSISHTAAADRDHGHDHGSDPVSWKLEKRATLDADFLADDIPTGALATPANGRTVPFPGHVIPGFSGVVDNRDGTFWGLPDNGFGTKENSTDFQLRLYRVRPHWETRRGGSGEIDVLDFISLRDPNHRIPFPIVNEATPDRLLTGGDFDIESVVKAKDGSFWIGEEFGPFIIHVDRRGVMLDAPVQFPDGKSPQNPLLAPGETPTVPRSRGFEAMAGSENGKYLYPIVEGALTTDTEARRRWIYEFDTRRNQYTGRRWAYETDLNANLVGDAEMIGHDRMIVIERDDFDGPRSVTKKLYQFDLGRTDDRGFVRKELMADLLYINNPSGIPADPAGGFGLGDPFSFPMQSVESVELLPGGRILIANDNNYPGNAARFPGTPDDTEMIVIAPDPHPERDPAGIVLIGHRGASGYRPEHTLESYELAIRQCADFIEPDVVSTKDGVLIARHENQIGGTTDISTRPEFADRKTTKIVDGVSITGWFTEDLTLAEIRMLRAKERLPQLRPANAVYDGMFDVPTLEEVIQLAQRYLTCDGREVGTYPETKHPTYFDSIGLSLEEPLLALLDKYGYDDERDPVYIQSFETGNLRELNTQTDVRLVQLINCAGAPYDLAAAGDTTTYADMVTPEGLAGVADYADGLGVCKAVMIPLQPDGTSGTPTSVVADAHAAGLEVHGWTFRAENNFLPAELRSSANPAEYGNLPAEISMFLDLGMDGFFTDNPNIGASVVG